ncbi:glycosyltransferase family 4 protein [Salinibacter ruber]|uniref:glycosyltransferase family 4 protein n=1 Tax=Salinibacter ruber TaxID=146919 RepID=UPI000E5844ED|nr:glycosyltransferase family 4 protein [Salinibacter ruber]
MKQIVFAKLPPPNNGMTIATQVFYRMAEEEIEVETIDTSYGGMRLSQEGLKRVQYDLFFSVQFAQQLRELRKQVQDPSVSSLYLVGSPSALGVVRNILAVSVGRSYVNRIIVHVHNGNYHQIFERGIVSMGAKYLVRNVDRFIFLSEGLSQRMSGYIPSQKRSVVRNTIDKCVRCTKDEVVQKIHSRSQRTKLRILFLSNMISSKGYKDVARAISHIKSQSSELSLHANLIGEWPDEHSKDEFHTFLNREGIADVCMVHGGISNRSQIKDVLLKTDVFLLPTYYPNEAQPLSIIEAMNAATPVVATEHMSIPEYVIDGENGYLVNKQAPREIADAIRDLSETTNWKAKARRARRTYEEMHSPSSVKKQFLQALESNGE